MFHVMHNLQVPRRCFPLGSQRHRGITQLSSWVLLSDTEERKNVVLFLAWSISMAHCLVTDQRVQTLIDNERNYWLPKERESGSVKESWVIFQMGILCLRTLTHRGMEELGAWLLQSCLHCAWILSSQQALLPRDWTGTAGLDQLWCAEILSLSFFCCECWAGQMRKLPLQASLL